MNYPSTPERRGKVPMIGAVLLAGLMMLVLPAGLAGAAPAPSVSSSHTLWAYGIVETVDFQGSSHGWQYSGNATYGYSAILNQTNTSATTAELTANRTMGAIAQVHYCAPNCGSPVYFGNESYHVYETVAADANLTTTGTVYENGAAVPAIALNSSAAHVRANLTEMSSSYRPILGVVGPRSFYLSANVVAASSVTLTPGLGILPTSLSTAQSWTSTSAFTANASAEFSWYEAASGPRGSGHVGPTTGDLTVPNHSGNVSLFGNFSPANTVVLGGVSYPEVALRLVGPFAVREGFILLPESSDLFGGGSMPWTGQQNDSATASMSYLDARPVVGGHLGIGASQWTYDSSTANPDSSIAGASGSSGLTPAMSSITDSAPPTALQGQPETVASAQTQQSCLLTGGGCPSGTTSSGGGLRGLAGILAVGVVVIVVVGVVVLVAERRRMPPPAYPNAALYPPGNARPGTRSTPNAPPPPAEDDPLRNLW